ncbi:hypothetical protein HPB52_025332 [Rhipicephalus sanguineus]|uniref:Sodium/potassium-transporting ATPase subunit beta n=1 Tax=Rhipicephalus sanguineus TaxID=34632 RepID=A0A9D4YSC6_RHISA|nr:hypothetical protein HPB52_025332 [Rhipicephalus sanguineus]
MAGKEGDYYKADKKEGGFLRFLYNPDTKEVFGRTGLSWFKITVFYIIFYACLTAFWTIMLIVFYQTLDTIRPTWVLDGSAIGTIPVLSGSTCHTKEILCEAWDYCSYLLIKMLLHCHNAMDVYIQLWFGFFFINRELSSSLAPLIKDNYDRQEADGEHLRTCSFEQPIDPKENKACRFALENIASNCSSAQQFGYEYGQPCVLLKLNRIFGWVPEPYDNGSYPQKLPDNVKNDYNPNYVYITCEGEASLNVADVESMGPLAYFPSNRIENFYFPYKNTPGYLSPFVFVQFLRPERGVLINMECKAWAKNIKHDRQDRIGSAHFELMVD